MTAAVESDGMEWVFAGLVAGKVCVCFETSMYSQCWALIDIISTVFKLYNLEKAPSL